MSDQSSPTDPYLGQIEIFAFDFPPLGWALCAGQLMSIPQNQALFALLGTAFGGDGMNTFALPDLQGCTPIGQGTGSGLSPRAMGTPVAGEENHALLMSETPFHGHNLWGYQDFAQGAPENNTFKPAGMMLARAAAIDGAGAPLAIDVYADYSKYDPAKDPPLKPMAESAISSVGGGQPHPNMMPFLTLNVCISLQGPPPPANQAAPGVS